MKKQSESHAQPELPMLPNIPIDQLTSKVRSVRKLPATYHTLFVTIVFVKKQKDDLDLKITGILSRSDRR